MKDLNKILEYQYSLDKTVDKGMQFTSIIILTYNQIEYTKLCIESIRKFTHKDIYELIVVDNNSTDETVPWLQSQSDIKVIFNNANYGVAKGYNQGIEVAKGNSILLLNNDVIVTPNWLDNLNIALWSDSKIGAVSCMSNYVSNAQKVNVDYNNLTEMLNFSVGFNISDKDKYEERSRLVGFCMLIKKEVIDKIGLLDEQFYPGNFEDDDYCIRISKVKYKLILCKDTFIHHYGNLSFKNNNIDYNKIFIENREKFKKKWFRQI